MELQKYNIDKPKVLKINQIVHTISETHKFDKDKLIAINTSDVENGVMGAGTLTPVEELKGQFKKTIKKDDILFSEIRPANRRFAKVMENNCADFVVSTKLMVLRKYNDDVDLEYFYYCLTNQPFLEILQRRAENRIGSFPQITFDLLSEYAFSIPSVEEQKRISKIIAILDRKIKLSRAINHNLEAMAKQLYDYWFVQFDFPNEEGKPYKSSGGKIVWNEKLKREIPEGWKLQSYGDLCHINKVTLSRKEDIQYIEYLDTSSLTKGVISATQELDRCKAPSRAQRKVEDLTILYSCVRPRLLHYGILCNPTKNLIASTGFATIDAIEKEHSFMLYMHLTTLDITEYLASIADTAVSSYPSINPSDIASLETLVPPKCIVRKFQERIEPMFRLKEKIRLENTNLTKQRDELLPLLMNGQVSVNYDLS